MAGYGTTQRPVAASSHPSMSEGDHPSRDGLELKLLFPFNIPPSPEAAALRIVRNLERLALYYATFVWTVLFITLVPKRKVSMVYLVATTEVTFLYFLLLRALPNSTVLHKIIDKRLVLLLLFIIAAVELILTRAGIHLFVTLAATTPVVLVHAVLWITDRSKEEDGGASGELVSLVGNEAGDSQLVDSV